MAKEKARFSCSLKESIISSVSDVAAKKGQSVSYVTSKYMIDGLKNERELTDAERYMWSMERITETIDRLLKIGKVHDFNGNVKESMLLLSSILILDKGYFESSTSYDKYRYSFFEVLDELSRIDKPLIDEITVILNEIQKKLKTSEISEEMVLFGKFRNSEGVVIKNNNSIECDISENEHNRYGEPLSEKDEDTIRKYKSRLMNQKD